MIRFDTMFQGGEVPESERRFADSDGQWTLAQFDAGNREDPCWQKYRDRLTALSQYESTCLEWDTITRVK